MAKKSIIFSVSGMHCTSCASRLENSLNKIDGVESCAVNFATNNAVVTFETDKTTQKILETVASQTGFHISVDKQSNIENSFFISDSVKVIGAWLIIIIMFAHMFSHSIMIPHIVKIILSGAVIFICGFDILKNAWSSLKEGIMGMDVLIALGGLTAWLSAFLPYLGIKIGDYTMTAGMLIAVNLTGRFIENIVRGKASQSVLALANFAASTANKVLESGEIVTVNTKELMIGDIIQIKNGEKIPTDGVIISGKTSADESFLTGESLPIEKREGDYVFGASINISGIIKVRVEKDSSSNLLAQTISLVQEAQGTKVPIQILADQVTKVFVPIILILSFLSFAIWFALPDLIPSFLSYFNIDFNPDNRLSDALSAGIAVLVIACPCALGLATPMALVTGSSLGAKKGILIRQGAAVQELNDVQVIALDKTGTLTAGKPQLMSIVTDGAIEKDHALKLLSGLEALSNHPLADTVVEYAKKNNITGHTFEEVTNFPGQGVQGLYDNTEWFVGSVKATAEFGISISGVLEQAIDSGKEKGETLICLSDLSRKECHAVVSFADSIKPDTLPAIQQLKQMDKRIIMITGDHQNAADTVAKKLNINSVIAEASPKQKLDNIKSLKEQGYKICFVGDGINDVAALEAADVGIAIGTGTDIANAAGDIVLVSGSLSGLKSSFTLASYTFKKIKQNLFWAFFYNIIAIPLAFSGLLHPIAAEIAMTFSSLTVIANSLLLAGKKI